PRPPRRSPRPQPPGSSGAARPPPARPPARPAPSAPRPARPVPRCRRPWPPPRSATCAARLAPSASRAAPSRDRPTRAPAPSPRPASSFRPRVSPTSSGCRATARRRATPGSCRTSAHVQAPEHAAFQAALSGSAPASECRGAYSTYVTRPSADVSPDQRRLGSRPTRAPEHLRTSESADLLAHVVLQTADHALHVAAQRARPIHQLVVHRERTALQLSQRAVAALHHRRRAALRELLDVAELLFDHRAHARDE